MVPVWVSWGALAGSALKLDHLKALGCDLIGQLPNEVRFADARLSPHRNDVTRPCLHLAPSFDCQGGFSSTPQKYATPGTAFRFEPASREPRRRTEGTRCDGPPARGIRWSRRRAFPRKASKSKTAVPEHLKHIDDLATESRRPATFPAVLPGPWGLDPKALVSLPGAPVL